MTERTYYSGKVDGDGRNYGMGVRFDKTGGYIGITQENDLVLLSPKQFKALVKFVNRKERE